MISMMMTIMIMMMIMKMIMMMIPPASYIMCVSYDATNDDDDSNDHA